MTSCDLPREPQMRDVAPQAMPDAVIDLAGCATLEITVWLYEHEKPGHRFESWPADVQRQFELVVFDWQNRNTATREVRAITTAIVTDRARNSRNAVMIVHHAAKEGP